MQVRFEVLKKGDSVINVWDYNIAIQRKNGDVEILHYDVGNDNLPRLSSNSILITYGNGIVKTKNDDTSIEVGTF